ncbi:MAG: glycoside hydrolase family 15 protein, partial [Steroidobacteraceae bacterium]
AYDPDPDYSFHWFRDSAIVVDALRLLWESGTQPRGWEHFGAFVDFSRSLGRLDGRELAASGEWRERVAPAYRQYLRPDEELARLHGEAIAADTRVNADGTLDITRWARPQHDGPALRALTVLRWLAGGADGGTRSASRAGTPGLAEAAAGLLSADLDFLLAHAREPCFDIWEEEHGLHYYTLRVSAAALDRGAAWLAARGEAQRAAACRSAAAELLAMLDDYWSADEGFYRSRILASGARSTKELDISVILATIHAAPPDAREPGRAEHTRHAVGEPARHSVHDPRIHATLERLMSLFDAEYPINHARPPDRAPAMGRYAADHYYSGGAYYFSTLAASELDFRAAAGAHEPRASKLRERGDAFLRTVRAFTPPSGDLAEQFDQRTGAQASAKQLAWSYAALISCAVARRSAGAAPPGAASGGAASGGAASGGVAPGRAAPGDSAPAG